MEKQKRKKRVQSKACVLNGAFIPREVAAENMGQTINEIFYQTLGLYKRSPNNPLRAFDEKSGGTMAVNQFEECHAAFCGVGEE